MGFHDISRDGEVEGVKGAVEDRWPGYVLQAGQGKHSLSLRSYSFPETQGAEPNSVLQSVCAAKDAISSAVVHPYLPILATVSGSRHEPPPVESDSDDASSSSDSDSEVEMVGQTRRPTRTLPKPKEAKLRIWSFTPLSLGTETTVAPPGEETAVEREATGGDQAVEVSVAEPACGLAADDEEEEEAQLNG